MTFEAGEDMSGGESPDGRAARLFEWVIDVSPGATTVEVHYSFLLRGRDGQVPSLYERQDVGLFPISTSTRALSAWGFSVDVVVERTRVERTQRRIFVGHKPVQAIDGRSVSSWQDRSRQASSSIPTASVRLTDRLSALSRCQR